MSEKSSDRKSRQIRIMAGLLCLPLLWGCSSNAPKKAESSKAGEEAVLTAFVQQAVTTNSGVWSGWAAQKLYDDTGIKVDFYATGSEVEQKLRQYISAGTLPDIIGFKDLDQAQLAMDAGLLLSLDDYQELLPSIFETEGYQKAVAYSRDNTSNDTKNLYIMPTSIGPVSYNAYNWMPMLQWDAYKRSGTPEIKTLEDYLEVVRKMMLAKPYTDKGEKVYGFSLFSDWDKNSALEIAALSYFYGIDTEYISPLMETNVVDKKTQSILSEDSFYKRALHFYFAANQMGLLDPDSMTQSYSNMEKKFSDGRVLFSWFSWLTGTYNDQASGNVNDEENPDGFVNILAEDMKIYEAPDQTIGRNWYFAINKSCKNVEKACEFLNWLYDPKVEAFLYNGPSGTLWERNSQGEPFVTKKGWEIIDKKSEDLMVQDGGGAFEDGVDPFNALGFQAAAIMEDGYTISHRYWPSSRKANETSLQKEVNAFLGTESVAEYLKKNQMTAKSTMAVNMIPAASDEMKSKISAIGEVVRQLSWQMVYASGEEEFESLWQSMREKANTFGMDQVEEYYKAAWEDALEKAAAYE